MSDRGGGVPVRKVERLFSYMYSTAPRPEISTHRRTPLVHTLPSHHCTSDQPCVCLCVCVTCTVCVSAGGVWLRAAALASLYPLLPGWPAALPTGGIRHGCRHPPKGKHLCWPTNFHTSGLSAQQGSSVTQCVVNLRTIHNIGLFKFYVKTTKK